MFKKEEEKPSKDEKKKEQKIKPEVKKEEKFTDREKEFLNKKKLRTKADILINN